ncbi:uracil-DNA glycosylase [Oxalobacteraceae bacterium GrIS 2.11]
MRSAFPEFIEQSLSAAHPSWQTYLRAGLTALAAAQPAYLPALVDAAFLPTGNRLFAAFAVPMSSVRYVLMGEGPYPREESATGVCFMDGAVKSLWQRDAGLSKQVNRATSLRNFIKMLLVAEGVLNIQNTTASALKPVAELACADDSGWIQTGAQLQSNLQQRGFLLLNASLVFRPEVPPAQDANAWLPFLRVVLQALHQQPSSLAEAPVQLILWGKIAEKVNQLPEAKHFAALSSEHPYNLSFIGNQMMQDLFRPLHILRPGSWAGKY